MSQRFTILSFLSALSLASPAVAQPPPLDRFSTLRFFPAPGANAFVTLDGATVVGHMVPSVGLLVDYAHLPFAIHDARCEVIGPDPERDVTNCETTGIRTPLVSRSIVGSVSASLAIAERFQVGLVLPVAYTEGDGFEYTRRDESGTSSVVAVVGGRQYGLADPRLVLKMRVAGDGPLGVAIAAVVSAPAGQWTADGSFLGDETVTAGGYVAGEWGHESGFRLAANVGGLYRAPRELFSTRVGSQLLYLLGAGYDLTPLLTALVELQGASSLGAQVDENPLEGRLALRWRTGDLVLTAGGGGGLVSGVGVPVYRIFLGAAWMPVERDTDGDGAPDEEDGCPDSPEDRDGWLDEDGCPEADNDGDGLLDGQDPCPDQAEDRDGFQDEDGCPDRDNDGDGIQDGYDSCVSEPEDVDGDRDEDGCPDNDRDRDGIADGTDRCPEEAEDTDGFGDEDGCPETDFDGDGIPDDGDECPDRPEVVNGVSDQDGCPETDADGDGVPDESDRCPQQPETLNGIQDDDGCPDGEVAAEVRGTQIVLLEQVQFRTNSHRLRGRRSQQILDAVALILLRNPQYRHVRIEGHTDDRGNRERNIALSQRRAQTCLEYLVRRGVARERLSAQGFGPDRPITDNSTPEGRTANRRVEFHIVDAPEVRSAATQIDPEAMGRERPER
ncbi:MAG: OmpA family protein [Myxococcales bacterium]|nr:OmpA family protein [Myxococcales bacterium]